MLRFALVFIAFSGCPGNTNVRPEPDQVTCEDACAHRKTVCLTGNDGCIKACKIYQEEAVKTPEFGWDLPCMVQSDTCEEFDSCRN